jgi:3-oxoacyl-[acyl-carrier-protein] synthase II
MSRRHDRIVITGSAAVTCLGITREDTWAAVRDGRCGMRELTALESLLPPGRLGGQALDLPRDYRPDVPREVRYLSWTVRDALADARALDALPAAPDRCGILLGTTLHGMRAGGEFFRSNNPESLRNFLAGSTLQQALAGFDLTGLAATTCSACSSSLSAIALAVTLLQRRELDLIVAGGYDTISEYVYGGFNALRLVAEAPLTPFARNRAGMKLAEGYGIIVLERLEDARRRSARPHAEILGYGESADAHHLTQPHPHGDGAARAIAEALRDARLEPGDIDLIAAHATGTPDNDAGEYAAFSQTFADNLAGIPVVAFKSHLGHTLGGAGAVELILSSLAMRDGLIPPCANSSIENVEFPNLKLATAARQTAVIRATLNTSLGFGGANTCCILGPAPAAPASAGACPNADRHHIRGSDEQDVVLTGIGVILPGAVGNEPFAAHLVESSDGIMQDTGSIPESQYIHLLNARRVRRMSDYVKITLAATQLAMINAKIENVTAFAEGASVILGSAHGSADFSINYYREIVNQGLIGANPVLFAEGVPNAAAAHLSLMLGLRGGCQTIIGTRTAGLDALRLAASRIAAGRWDRAIVGAAEEFNLTVNAAYEHCGLKRRNVNPPDRASGFVTGSAAVTFILESRRCAEGRGARGLGRILACSSHRGRPRESVDAAARVLAELSSPRFVLTSGCDTWVDRAELAALRRAVPGATVSTLYGHAAEHFSASPLLAIASVLLTARMPRMLWPAPPSLHSAGGDERPDSFAALCTDFTGCVSGVTLATA